MSSYIFDYVCKNTNTSNYKYQNMNNIYNFIYEISEGKTEEEIKELNNKIKKNIGMTFYNDYRSYLFRKGLMENNID